MFGKKKRLIQKVEETPLFHLDFKPEIPTLPEIENKEAVNLRYPLIPPYAYAHIYWDNDSKELIYFVEEPELTDYEKRVLAMLEEGIKELINISFVSVQEGDTLINYLEKNIRVLLDELRIKLTKYSYLKLMYYIYRDFVGLNEVEPFLNDYFVEDIECNGVDYPIYIVHRKYRNLRTNITFTDVRRLTSFVEKLAQKCGQYISYATPLLDGALPDGSRVNATFTEEISTRGPTFTVRKFTKEPWTPIQLMKFGTVSPELLAYLWILIEHELNIMIIGGTGSGKTTFLNALTFFIPPQARIVSIEDTRELNLKHDNWLPSVARAGVGLTNLVGQRYGEVSLFDLLKESFRQRPDYVIVGEVRGKEAFVLFQGMASLPPNEKVLVLNSNKRKFIPIRKINAEKSRAICINPITEKTEIYPIKILIKHPPRDKFIKIKTKTGREVTTTGDHSLFTYKNGILPIEAKNLKVNDCIIIPSRTPVGYSNISFINFIDYLHNIRVFSPEYIKKAVEILGYEKASKIAKVKSISDYYAKFKRSLPSSIKAEKFKLLMKRAKIKYDLEKIKVKFLRKSKLYDAKFKITPEFLRFLGYYIAEGSLNNSGKNSRISLYAKDRETVKDMIKCIKSLNCKPRKRITKGFGSSTELSFSHKVLFEFLLKYCRKGSYNKRIPDFIFGLSKEKIGEFLFALYKGDGSIRRNSINYYTTSRKLVNDLTYLLLEFGIVAHIIKRGKSKIGKKENYEIKFYKVEYKKEFLRYVKIANKELINSIYKIKGRNDINNKNDIYLDKIKSVEEIKLKKPLPVYDISIPKRQNFVGGFGGVMLHNSGHPSFSTMHANSVDTMIKRLQTPPINLSSSLVETLDVVCVITQTKVKGKEVRRIREINEIINVQEEKGAIFNTPFIWNPQTDSFFFKPDSYVFRKLYSQQGIQRQTLEREFKLRTKLLVKLYQHKIFNFKEVQDIINEYYKSPELVLRRFKVI